MTVPPILCVVGASGSGKTTLLEGLVAKLAGEALKVGAIKHAAGGLDLTAAGKDSSRLAEAGARPVVAAGPGELTVTGGAVDASPAELAERFCGACDLVLAEGFKRSPHDKVLVAAETAAGEAAGISSVRLAVAGAERDDISAIAAWVRQWLGRRRELRAGVIGAILAGGQSRRMGTDKAALRLQGQPVLAHLAELLADRVEAVWVVGRSGPDELAGRFVRWHLDLRAGCGPLGGVATALHLAADNGPRAVLAVACDLPALGADVIDGLLEGRQRDAAASAVRNPSTGRVEPLMAVYEPDVLAEVERALDAGRRSATALLEAVGAHVVEIDPSLAGQLVNVNTPGDLDRIEGRP